MSGATIRACVLGWPAKHSLSPRLHGCWLKRHGIDGEYTAIEVRPEAFERTVGELAAAGFAGANVTLPHKHAALAMARETTAAARAIGAANTLVFDAKGVTLADNTDAYGFMAHLETSAPGWRRDLPAVVLGAGGAARAVIFALAEAGVPEIRLANRTAARAEGLVAEFGAPVRACAWDARAAALEDAGLLVNTTSLGMAGQPPLDIALDALPEEACVYDIVYRPLETQLLAAARARGLAGIDGLGMLLWQAQPGFERWFGVRPEVDETLRADVLKGIEA